MRLRNAIALPTGLQYTFKRVIMCIVRCRTWRAADEEDEHCH